MREIILTCPRGCTITKMTVTDEDANTVASSLYDCPVCTATMEKKSDIRLTAKSIIEGPVTGRQNF